LYFIILISPYRHLCQLWTSVFSSAIVGSIPVVNFINILGAAFAPIFFCQKVTKPNSNLRKGAQSTCMKKAHA
jgi:hypothetical protein